MALVHNVNDFVRRVQPVPVTLRPTELQLEVLGQEGLCIVPLGLPVSFAKGRLAMPLLATCRPIRLVHLLLGLFNLVKQLDD